MIGFTFHQQKKTGDEQTDEKWEIPEKLQSKL